MGTVVVFVLMVVVEASSPPLSLPLTSPLSRRWSLPLSLKHPLEAFFEASPWSPPLKPPLKPLLKPPLKVPLQAPFVWRVVGPIWRFISEGLGWVSLTSLVPWGQDMFYLDLTHVYSCATPYSSWPIRLIDFLLSHSILLFLFFELLLHLDKPRWLGSMLFVGQPSVWIPPGGKQSIRYEYLYAKNILVFEMVTDETLDYDLLRTRDSHSASSKEKRGRLRISFEDGFSFIGVSAG